MKRLFFVKCIALLSIVALIVSACGQATTPSTSGNTSSSGSTQANTSNNSASSNKDTKQDEPASGGELSFALATSPDTLDPHRSGLAVAVRVFRTIYDSLVVQLPDNSIAPWLATEWEISEDGLSYTFKLREDVTFHDGTPFNAEAVKYSFDRILDPETKAANSTALLRPYKGSEVLDEFTIRLDLETPSVAFLGNLSQAMLGIVSPTAAKEYGDQFGQNPVGTGPFRFTKWEENTAITVERNPDYAWGPELVSHEGPAYLDSISFKIITEEATRIGSVQSGQVHAAETVPPQNVVALQKDTKLQLLQVNTGGLPYTLFFNHKHEPWGNVKARQAVQAAVDVDSIVKSLYLGTYERAWSPLAPTIFGYDASLEGKIVHDVDKANQLLDEIGYVRGADGIREKDGQKLTLRYVDRSPNREKRNDIAVIIQQQLKEVGIAVEVDIVQDIATVVHANGNYDLYGNSQVNSDPVSLNAFYRTVAPGARDSLSRLSDPVLDEWLDQAAVEHDLSKRAELYSKVQHYIIDNASILPIYVFPYTVAATKDVDGIVFDSLGYPIFNDTVLQAK